MNGVTAVNIMSRKLILALLASCLLSACVAKREVAKIPPMPPKKTIMAIGYGTVEANNFTKAQRRLMGMRASKVEAYRALSEQIYGVHINGNTTVENMAAKYDNIRAYVNTIVHGARVKRITAIDADTYETVLEVDLTPQFYECFGASEAHLNSCLSASVGAPIAAVQPELVEMPPMLVGASCHSLDCYRYPEVHGFIRPY